MRDIVALLSSSPKKRRKQTPSSESESDLDDPLAILTGKTTVQGKVKASIEPMATGAPPPRKLPSFARLDPEKVETWKRSNMLISLHAKDDEEAVDRVREEEDFRAELREKLHRDAYNDTQYVEYMIQHKDSPNLKDFYYLGVPSITDRDLEVSDPVEFSLFSVEMGISWLSHNDVMNQTHILAVERALNTPHDESIDDDDLRKFMMMLGANDDHWDSPMTSKDLKLDSKHKRQPIPLVIKKLMYIVRVVQHCNIYSSEMFVRVMQVLGYIMMDYRVLSSNVSYELTECVNRLLKWQYENTDTIEFQLVIDTWLSLTELVEFNYRILSTLMPSISKVIQILRRSMALSILVAGSPAMALDTPQKEADSIVYTALCGVLTEFGKNTKDLTENGYAQWMTKLKAALMCMGNDKTHPLLPELRRLTRELEMKIPVSHTNQAQSVCRSTLLLLSSVLNPGIKHASVIDEP